MSRLPQMLNQLGVHSAMAGYPPDTDMSVAKKVDLIVLPKGVQGTNCGNCMWVKQAGNGLACSNPKVKQPVTTSECCALWDRRDVARPWGKQASNL